MFNSRLPPNRLVKQTKTQATGQPHQASMKERNFHNIRIKKTHKACEKQTGNLNLTKQRASPEGETFAILEDNCINERIVDCVNKNKTTLLYILIVYLISVYNIWHAKNQLHMISMKHVQIKTTSPTSVFVLKWTGFNWYTFMYHTGLIQTFWNVDVSSRSDLLYTVKGK